MLDYDHDGRTDLTIGDARAPGGGAVTVLPGSSAAFSRSAARTRYFKRLDVPHQETAFMGAVLGRPR